MLWNKNKAFCNMNPVFYAISEQKEIFKRHIRNMTDHTTFAACRTRNVLPNLVSSHSSNLIKRGKGIDIRLQETVIAAVQPVDGGRVAEHRFKPRDLVALGPLDVELIARAYLGGGGSAQLHGPAVTVDAENARAAE